MQIYTIIQTFTQELTHHFKFDLLDFCVHKFQNVIKFWLSRLRRQILIKFKPADKFKNYSAGRLSNRNFGYASCWGEKKLAWGTVFALFRSMRLRIMCLLTYLYFKTYSTNYMKLMSISHFKTINNSCNRIKYSQRTIYILLELADEPHLF